MHAYVCGYISIGTNMYVHVNFLEYYRSNMLLSTSVYKMLIPAIL